MSAANKLSGAGAVLTVDLDAIAENYKNLAGRARAAVCAAVVKADAYGLGLEPVARALFDAGARHFFVAIPDEAVGLRNAVPDAHIYVLDGLVPGCAPLLLQAQAIPVLGSLQEIGEWGEVCATAGHSPKAALHVDTGMNRLGLGRAEVDRLVSDPDLLSGIDTCLIMSHLACADERDHPMNRAQLEHFRAVAAQLPQAPLSLANSAGVLNGPEYHFDLVRPGIALYGGNGRRAEKNPMKPVIHLEGCILQVRDIRRGETVGYGATFKAKEDMRVATIAAGYADGYLRALGSSDKSAARVYIGGRPAPVIGRISMDLIAADVTKIPKWSARRGAMAELIGPNIGIDKLAHLAGTIAYEILTGLSGRYHRLYLGGKLG